MIEKQIKEQKTMNAGRVGKLGMLHLNGNVLCAIDTETTGPLAGFNDIIQICVLPLDAALNPLREVIPFYCDLKPKRPENCGKDNIVRNRMKLCKAAIDGLDAEFARDLFEEWFEKLKLVYPHKISPLASNWAHDRAFLIDWLGRESFNQFFDSRFRDTQAVALYLNDRNDFRAERARFGRVGLTSLCRELKVSNEFAHDALQDCIATTEVYKQLIKI